MRRHTCRRRPACGAPAPPACKPSAAFRFGAVQAHPGLAAGFAALPLRPALAAIERERANVPDLAFQAGAAAGESDPRTQQRPPDSASGTIRIDIEVVDEARPHVDARKTQDLPIPRLRNDESATGRTRSERRRRRPCAARRGGPSSRRARRPSRSLRHRASRRSAGQRPSDRRRNCACGLRHHLRSALATGQLPSRRPTCISDIVMFFAPMVMSMRARNPSGARA